MSQRRPQSYAIRAQESAIVRDVQYSCFYDKKYDYRAPLLLHF